MLYDDCARLARSVLQLLALRWMPVCIWDHIIFYMSAFTHGQEAVRCHDDLRISVDEERQMMISHLRQVLAVH